MRNAAAILLFLWILPGAAALAGHAQAGTLPAARIFSANSDWEFYFGAPMPISDPPPECALTGRCASSLVTRIRCVEIPGCTARAPIFAGQGRTPRGYAFANDRGLVIEPVTNIPVPPSATLLLGGALLVPLLMPRRWRRRRR